MINQPNHPFFRWSVLADMLTPRCNCAAVHITGLGDLVLGGITCDLIYKSSNTAELLQSDHTWGENTRVWRMIKPMIKKRDYPSAVYFDKRVFVVSRCESEAEMLTFVLGQPGQWTLLKHWPMKPQMLHSMGVFDGRCFLLCEFRKFFSQLYSSSNKRLILFYCPIYQRAGMNLCLVKIIFCTKLRSHKPKM